MVQIEQDLALCAAKFAGRICRPIVAEFIRYDLITLFELEESDRQIAIATERHYRLVPSEKISPEDLKAYRIRSTND